VTDIDIVVRLREAADQGQDIYGIHTHLEREAATEIERLRAMLVKGGDTIISLTARVQRLGAVNKQLHADYVTANEGLLACHRQLKAQR